MDRNEDQTSWAMLVMSAAETAVAAPGSTVESMLMRGS
jgi:hypothetical protein